MVVEILKQQKFNVSIDFHALFYGKTVHGNLSKHQIFCRFRCATLAPITVFINVFSFVFAVFYSFKSQQFVDHIY